MRRVSGCLAGLAALLLMPAPGAAQDKTLRADAQKLERCVREAGRDTRQDCIGLVADPCLARPEGQTTIGTAACYDREAAAWDRLLNDWYRDLGKGAAEVGAADSLKAAQRAWIAFRDADCTLAYDLAGGGSLRTVTGSWCLRNHTAERAMALLAYMEP